MKNFIYIFSIFICNALFGDSPLTSTEFYKAYEYHPIVQKAMQCNGEISEELMSFLSDSTNGLELKLASINALGWNIDGTDNSIRYKKFCELNYGINDIALANADIIICYAYLKALDNYFDVYDAFEFAQIAKTKKSNSYSIGIICALIEAQIKLDDFDNWCSVYQALRIVLDDESLNDDMSSEAVDMIMEYISSYEEYCN